MDMEEDTLASFGTTSWFDHQDQDQDQQELGLGLEQEHEQGQRWLQTTTTLTASELYDQVVFKTDALFNQPAPEYWISFIIGGVLSLFGFLLWVRRVYQTKQDVEKLGVKKPFGFGSGLLLRAMISRAIDNDDPTYTVVSFGAFSFLFLGGIQLSYQTTLVAMLIVYAVASFGDSARILLAVKSATSLQDVVQTSSIVHSSLRKKQQQQQATTKLNPSNVYEDLGRGKTIVIMVFVTQCILISFVVRRLGSLLLLLLLRALCFVFFVCVCVLWMRMLLFVVVVVVVVSFHFLFIITKHWGNDFFCLFLITYNSWCVLGALSHDCNI